MQNRHGLMRATGSDEAGNKKKKSSFRVIHQNIWRCLMGTFVIIGGAINLGECKAKRRADMGSTFDK